MNPQLPREMLFDNSATATLTMSSDIVKMTSSVHPEVGLLLLRLLLLLLRLQLVVHRPVSTERASLRQLSSHSLERFTCRKVKKLPRPFLWGWRSVLSPKDELSMTSSGWEQLPVSDRRVFWPNVTLLMRQTRWWPKLDFDCDVCCWLWRSNFCQMQSAKFWPNNK